MHSTHAWNWFEVEKYMYYLHSYSVSSSSVVTRNIDKKILLVSIKNVLAYSPCSHACMWVRAQCALHIVWSIFMCVSMALPHAQLHLYQKHTCKTLKSYVHTVYSNLTIRSTYRLCTHFYSDRYYLHSFRLYVFSLRERFNYFIHRYYVHYFFRRCPYLPYSHVVVSRVHWCNIFWLFKNGKRVATVSVFFFFFKTKKKRLNMVAVCRLFDEVRTLFGNESINGQ